MGLITRDPSRLVSGVVLILVGAGQAFHVVSINTEWTLVVAGALFIMEALRW
jgi:hypothetical protein